MALRLFDDLGREHVLLAPAQRVVSLVPSDTHSIAALGAADRLVGRTAYCIEPPGLPQPTIGGTKDARVDEIVALGPDLVLANKEENTPAIVTGLARAGVRVFVSFPSRAAEGVAHLARLARMLGCAGDPRAKELVRDGYAALQEADIAAAPPLRAFVPIWIEPWMTIHGSTYVSDVLAQAGFENVFADRSRRYPLAADLGAAPAQDGTNGRDTRYPRITVEEIVARAPDVILLPDEPYAFGDREERLLMGLDLPAARHGAIARCPGKDLSWYGAQTGPGLRALRRLAARLGTKVRA